MTLSRRIAFDPQLPRVTEPKFHPRFLPPPRLLTSKAAIGSLPRRPPPSFTPLPLRPPLLLFFYLSFQSTMPASTHEIPAINLYIPGASAATSDIPVELSTSPSSLDVDHEQLTVCPPSAGFSPSADLSHFKANRALHPCRYIDHCASAWVVPAFGGAQPTFHSSSSKWLINGRP